MDLTTKEFLNNYAPGNHWLSKSMEVSRNDVKGTYWYIKKFVTFYYFVFVKKQLDRNGLKQISDIFENYCESVANEVKDKAYEFFFERDIRKVDEIITLNEFLYNTDALEEDSSKMNNARKYYFSYLMNIEEQNNKKKLIFDKTIEARNYFKGIELASELFRDKTEFNKLVQDVHAFLRNQRQILYFLGIVNYTKINNKEEYAPTDFGKHIVFSNYNELILLLEVQKLRQVSRNPLVMYSEDFNRPRNRQIKENADKSVIDKGHICSHPYFVLLKYLIKHQELKSEDYRFVVSRISDIHNTDDVISLKGSKELGNLINEKDKRFYNPGCNTPDDDFVIGTEDFSKEYKKYMQGIFAVDLDCYSDLLAIGKLDKSVCKISDKEKADILYKNYVDIIDYLDKAYDNLYRLTDKIQNEKYACHINRQNYNDKSAEYLAAVEEWMNYFVSSDTNIIRMMLKTVAEMNNLQKREVKQKYPYLCEKILRIKTNADIEKMFINPDFEEVELPVVVVKNKVTEDMLINKSSEYLNIMHDFVLERKRNSELRNMYATYKYQHKNCICEICGANLSTELNGNLICNYHHILPFNEAGALGPDHYLNIIGICPNCHDKIHSKLTCNERKEMYNGIQVNSCFAMGVFERIKTMYKAGYLFNASLEYAVAMGMITETQKLEIINDRS